MPPLTWLPEDDDASGFPPLQAALREPNGLLAAGGTLSPGRLETAYRAGIFPWFSEGQPILWWSPDPRAVLFPEQLRIRRSLRQRIRRGEVELSFDRAFEAVMRGCAAPRRDHPGTWISESMIAAYLQLHVRGLAHSVEVWHGQELVGGLYGVAIGGAFFGESMFSREADASKQALVYLCHHLRRWGYRLIDCQMETPHLSRLGAVLMPRAEFARRLAEAVAGPGQAGSWSSAADTRPLVALLDDTI